METGARYVVFGEALTDFIREEADHWRSVAGGSCWNVARVGARLGIATGFAGAVSSDLFGNEIVRACSTPFASTVATVYLRSPVVKPESAKLVALIGEPVSLVLVASGPT